MERASSKIPVHCTSNCVGKSMPVQKGLELGHNLYLPRVCCVLY